MNVTKAAIVIALMLVSFGAGIGVDRLMTPPQTPAQPIVYQTWGATLGEASTVIATNFTRTTGIPVLFEYHAGASSTVIPKISSAWPNVQIDLTSTSPGVAYQLAQQGYLAELKPEEIPVMKEIPDSLFLRYEGKIVGAPMYVLSVLNVVWRTDLISDPIKTWDDLLKPEYNKKIALAYPGMGAGADIVGTAWMFGGDENNIDPGFQKLKELAPHIGGIITSDAEQINFLASGQYPIEVFAGANNVYAVHQQGVPIAWGMLEGVPKPTFEVAADVIVVINGPRAAEAKQFVNYFLGARNNEYFCNANGVAPSNMNAKPSADLTGWVPTADQVAKYGKQPDAAVRAQNIDAWTQRWDTEIVPLIGTG